MMRQSREERLRRWEQRPVWLIAFIAAFVIALDVLFVVAPAWGGVCLAAFVGACAVVYQVRRLRRRWGKRG